MLFAIDNHMGNCMVPPGATPGYLDYQGNLIMGALNQKELASQSPICFER